MANPTIEGLTARQKTLADLIWNCVSEDQVKDFIRALPTKQDQIDASSLVKIMLWEVVESEGFLDHYESTALEIIERVR